MSTIRSRHWLLAAAAVVASSSAVSAAIVVPGPAALEKAATHKVQEARPGPDPKGLNKTSPAEEVLPAVAEKIHDLGRDDGFVGQTTNQSGRRIKVTWAGAVPDDVRAYIESMPYGVSVEVVEGARYSRAEMESARARLQADPFARDIKMMTASVLADGSGLELGLARAEALTPEELERLAAIAGIRGVRVQYGVKPTQGFASRTNDAAPWKGRGRTALA